MEMFITGIDFICAAFTLTYVGRLVFDSIPAANPVGLACSVAKVSLRGQQVARKMR